MVELRNVKGLVQFSVIKAVKRHCVGSYGRAGILPDNSRLRVDEFLMTISMRKIPFKLYMRVVPSVKRRGNILKTIIGLAKKI